MKISEPTQSVAHNYHEDYINQENLQQRSEDIRLGEQVDELNQIIDRKLAIKGAKKDIIDEALRVDDKFAGTIAHTAMLGEVEKAGEDVFGDYNNKTAHKLLQQENNQNANTLNRIHGDVLVKDALKDAAVRGIDINYPSTNETAEVIDVVQEVKESIKPRSGESALSFTQRLLRSNYKDTLDDEGYALPEEEFAKQVAKEHYEANKDSIQEEAIQDAANANLQEPVTFHPEAKEAPVPKALESRLFIEKFTESTQEIVELAIRNENVYGDYEHPKISIEDENPGKRADDNERRGTTTKVHLDAGEDRQIDISYVHGGGDVVITLTKPTGEVVKVSKSKDQKRDDVGIYVKRKETDEFVELVESDFGDGHYRGRGEDLRQNQINALVNLAKQSMLVVWNENSRKNDEARKIRQEANNSLIS